MPRWLKFVLTTVAGLVLLLALVVGAGIWLNAAAESQAQALCDSLPAGTAEGEAVARGERAGARHFTPAGAHEFRFQGWVFNAASCRVRVEQGRVVATTVSAADDS